jgi:hypothetical protein
MWKFVGLWFADPIFFSNLRISDFQTQFFADLKLPQVRIISLLINVDLKNASIQIYTK